MKIGLREIVLVVLLASTPLGAWWFVFRPRDARNQELLEQIEAKQEKLRALNRVTGTIGDLQQEIEGRRKAIGYFQAKLPSEKDIDRVLQEIWRLAEASQLITKSIRTVARRTNAPAGGPREQPVTIQLEGDFVGFYTFLQALENQPRIMHIGRMTLTKFEKGDEGDIQASFEMSVFFEQEGKGAACPPKNS